MKYLAMFYLNSDTFQLKCIISHKDGNKYCVRHSDQLQESVELLAEATERMKQIVAHLKEKFPKDERVKLLVKNFNPHRIVETLPTSEYTAIDKNRMIYDRQTLEVATTLIKLDRICKHLFLY